MTLSTRRFSNSLFERCAPLLVVLSVIVIGRADGPSPEVIRMFPSDLDGFHRLPSIRPSVTLAKLGILRPEYFLTNSDPRNAAPFLGGEMEYTSANGNKLLVEILRTQSDSNAYSLLTLAIKKAKEADQSQNIELGDVGTASIVTGRAVAFFKGAVFVRVTNERANDSQPAVALARLLAATFDKGEDDIPVLVKHLPSWQAYQQNADVVLAFVERSEEHTSELQSLTNLVCRLLL